VARALLERWPEVIRDVGGTALVLSLHAPSLDCGPERGDRDAVAELLLARGAPAEYVIAEPIGHGDLRAGDTPLAAAVWSGNARLARALLDRGAQLAPARIVRGRTILNWAVSGIDGRWTDREILRLLRSRGLDLRSPSAGGPGSSNDAALPASPVRDLVSAYYRQPRFVVGPGGRIHGSPTRADPAAPEDRRLLEARAEFLALLEALLVAGNPPLRRTPWADPDPESALTQAARHGDAEAVGLVLRHARSSLRREDLSLARRAAGEPAPPPPPEFRLQLDSSAARLERVSVNGTSQLRDTPLVAVWQHGKRVPRVTMGLAPMPGRNAIEIAYAAKAKDGILVRLERSARRVGEFEAIRTLRLPSTGGAPAVERITFDAPDAPLPPDRPLTSADEHELLDLVRRRAR
jgi:hypothetical protein